MGKSLSKEEWEQRAQAPDSSSLPPDPAGQTPRARTLRQTDRTGVHHALPLSRHGPARRRRCIPGAGEAPEAREAREAAAASIRSRWRAKPAPAPEAGLKVGRGLRASGSELGNPARPPHSPLSAAAAEPPDAASQGSMAYSAPKGPSPEPRGCLSSFPPVRRLPTRAKAPPHTPAP